MSQADLDHSGREEYPLHYAVADALGGKVRPFDVYQGPYISIPGEGRIFINTEDGMICQWFNEHTNRVSPEFSFEDENGAVDAAIAILEHEPKEIHPYGTEREEQLKKRPQPEEGSETPEWNPTDKDKEFLQQMKIKGTAKNK
jgi:hypothetical protein